LPNTWITAFLLHVEARKLGF